MTALSLTLAAALQVLAFGPGELARPERVAQLAGDPQASAAATDRARARVAQLGASVRREKTEKARLRSTYNRQLAEIDKLKRQRRSWRRDRELGDKKAKSLRTAKALDAVDGKLRRLSAQLKQARVALLGAVSRELKGTVAGSRRRGLEKLHASLSKSLRPKARKIFLPDEDFDELADADELMEQITLLREAELELAKQEAELGARAKRYARMDNLRRKNQRAGRMSELDEESVRRSSAASATAKTQSDGARGAGGAGAGNEAGGVAEPSADADDETPPPEDLGDGFDAGGGGGEPTPTPDLGGSLEENSIALADVVDASTRDALRKAGRSNDPGAKATAAKRARAQVSDRLSRLRKSRAAIEAHLRRLRGK